MDQIETTRAAEVETDRATLQAEISACDQRLKRLMTVYLDNAISVEEFKEAKNALVLERLEKVQQMDQLAKGVSERLEKLRAFVSSSCDAACIVEREDPSEIVRFFKSVSLNMTLRDRRLTWEPREAWQLIAGRAVVQMGGAGRSGRREKARGPGL